MQTDTNQNTSPDDAGMPLSKAAVPGVSALTLSTAAPNTPHFAIQQAASEAQLASLRDHQHEQQSRELVRKQVQAVDENALAELRGLAEGGEDLAPERGRELATGIVGLALGSTDHDAGTLAVLVTTLQKTAPESYGQVITHLAHSGQFFMLMTKGTDPIIAQHAMLLRIQLIKELGLTTCHEFAVLDVAVGHWVEARKATFMAHNTKKPSDYARLIQVAQAADKIFTNMIQQLRCRHEPRISALHVDHATNLAVQVNQGGQPVGRDANRVTCGPPRQVADLPAEGTDPYLFDKN